ncbi:MAG: putative type restriction endonuclease [Adhaeribacter sp.]|nr:putative type restriction endonuclease [Adhaeribacter sp.]
MFYYPQRAQAIKIQQTLKTLYAGVEGEYYGGDEAWEYLQTYTGVNLKAILTEIANERVPDVSIELENVASEVKGEGKAKDGNK